MRFKVDENLPVQVAHLLISSGHDADTVNDEGLSGTQDTDLGAKLIEEERALVTLDRGFGDIRTFPPSDRPGTIILRPETQDIPSVLALLESVTPLLLVEPLKGRLWIVEPDRIRIRT